MKNEKLKLLDLQIKGSYGLIAVVIVFLLINYDLKKRLLGQEPIFSADETRNIVIINRIIALAITLLFLYINYKDYQLVIENEQYEELRGVKLQIGARVLETIAAAIVLYVVINNYNFPLSVDLITNPEI